MFNVGTPITYVTPNEMTPERAITGISQYEEEIDYLRIAATHSLDPYTLAHVIPNQIRRLERRISALRRYLAVAA